MKLLDLFPTADALFRATHEPEVKDLAEDERRAELRYRIYQEDKGIVEGLRGCTRHQEHHALLVAFFCTLDEAIREATNDESLGASAGRPLCCARKR